MWAVRADRVRVGRPDLPAQHERQVGTALAVQFSSGLAGLYLLTNVSDELGPVGVVRFVSPFHYFNASRALVPDHGLDLPSGLALIAMTVTMLGAAASAQQYLIVVPIVTAYVLTRPPDGWRISSRVASN